MQIKGLSNTQLKQLFNKTMDVKEDFYYRKKSS